MYDTRACPIIEPGVGGVVEMNVASGMAIKQMVREWKVLIRVWCKSPS